MSHPATAAARPSEKDAEPRNRTQEEPPPSVEVDPDDEKEEKQSDGATQDPGPDPIGRDPGRRPS